jgi:hypothetical protein
MEKEIWKTHSDFENYEFSNLGKYKANGILKNINQNSRDGYIKIVNRKTNKTYYFHRIIAELFCEGKSDENKIVDHINGLRDDNRAENLRWVTYAENSLNKRIDGAISTKCLKSDYSTDKGYVKFLEEQINRLQKDVEFWHNTYIEYVKINIKINMQNITSKNTNKWTN